MMQACMFGHLECARWLLDQGSDVNQAKPDGTTAVLLAACVNRSDLIGFLHTRGADLSSQIGPFKQTYLWIACHHEAVEAVQILLDLGASTALIRISQNETTSCLDFAATRGSIRLMNVLLGHPAYPVEHRTEALLMLLDPELDRVDHLHAFLEHPSEQSVRTIDKPDVRAAFCNPPQKPATARPHALTLSPSRAGSDGLGQQRGAASPHRVHVLGRRPAEGTATILPRRRSRPRRSGVGVARGRAGTPAVVCRAV